MSVLKIGTIFSGIGAPEEGLKKIGVDFKTVFACDNGDREIDIDYVKEFEKVRSLPTAEEKEKYVESLYAARTRKINYVQQTYQANHTSEHYFQDVKLLDGTDFRDKIDLFIGGSPCQSFSVGSQDRLGFRDPRGTLFFEFCRLVNEIKPKTFIYENVFGVLRHDNGKTWDIMQNSFDDLGYHYKWKILNAKDYGIPQNRRRLFVVGFKDKEACDRFSFPKPIELKCTMQDFLEDNPDETYFLSEKMKKYVLTPGTKNFTRKIETDKKIASTIVKGVYNTYRAGINNYVTVGDRLRHLTVKEIYRLMGFPNSFVIPVSRTQAGRQAGNSIVVNVISAIENEIIKVL